jgi:5-methylcytosine-specific restriction enzyme A
MPQRAKHPCAAHGCAALIEAGRYCVEHTPNQSQREARPNAHQRGYGAQWQRLRLRVLRSHPLCADPFGEHARRSEVIAATDIDHIVAKRRGGRDEDNNLQALCHSCHSRKTNAQDGGGF